MAKNESLQNQIYLYSLETKDFYTDEEKEVSDKYFKCLRIKKRYTELRTKVRNDKELSEELIKRKIARYDNYIKRWNKLINTFKSELTSLLKKFEGVRALREDELKSNKIISIFESTLTRVCKMERKKVTEEMFIIRIFHYDVLRNIINNGFNFKGKHYSYFTSSAGQIRTRKVVTINSELFDKVENTITCGLTLEEINFKGGVNANKYQAYFALINSASDTWKRFNIDRIVVVDDFATTINAEVDYINDETYEISREFRDITLEHMDGCGVMLPSVSKKSFMFRMPWMKGLLTPFDFKRFAIENGNTKITDIYGKEWDILEDNINIILTKSQFKMWKYYDSWEEYKEKFKKYRCEASKLNIEDIGSDANINYQMLQTLTSMVEEELKTIAQPTVDDILQLGSDRNVMLRVLGATKENIHKNYFQKSLLLYPELLSDTHSREVIKNKKKSLVRDARAGKLRVNGKYTFIIPDLYAFCEWLFLGIQTPNGLLNNGEVYCDIFNEGKVDILRAPHLYREHAIRENIKREQLEKWFISKGVYISSHDLISRILQCDFDGDRSLVVQDEVLINVAERDMKGIVPLFYDMKKAESVIITPEEIYTALTSAYKANIGIISNDITKIWNSDNPNINAVKWLTAFNNYVIDYAKTLYLPEPPKYAAEIIKEFTKNKVPHFFKYAKDKEAGQVEPLNNSTVNKLHEIIPNKPIQFKKISGKFNHRDLMNTKFPVPSQKLIDEYERLNKEKVFWLDKNPSTTEYHFNKMMRDELSKIHDSEHYIVDVLVDYLYSNKSRFKNGLWDVYGDILYGNLEKNLEGTINCERCGVRAEKTNEHNTYCTPCSKVVKKEMTRLRVIKHRKSKKCNAF